MYQKLVLSLVTVLVSLSLFLTPVLALHNPNSNDSRIPEQEGTYDDPGHPGVKVRVYVHRERPDKAAASALVCDLSDPDSSAVVSPAGWHLPSNWTYNLNPSSVPSSVGSANLATIAANGFNDWAAATDGKVTFARGVDTAVTRSIFDGKNIIAWGRTSGSALGVTYIRYYSSSGLVVDVDTVMNKKFPWSWSNSSTCADATSYDAENILEHELGHWLGLDDEYDASYQHAAMYGYGSKAEVKKTTLTSGDIAGVLDLYN